jgi:uncharacterized protein
MDFEWDDHKNAANMVKHFIGFEVAIGVFVDPDAIEFDVSRAADQEERRKRVGKIGDFVFTVVFTPRQGVCRLISARRANKNEELRYGHNPHAS